MQKIVPLSLNLEIPRIVTGLWQIADMERHGDILNPQKAAAAMQAYAAAGLTAFDMADHYGSSEIIAGVFKNQYAEPQQIKLFTKWVPKPGKITRKDVRAAINLALERTQQETIDLLQFHAWFYPDPSWLDGLMYLNELRETGLIKHLGVTNFDAAHLNMALASGIPLVSNQICHSVIDQRAMGEMAKVCQKHDVKILAFGTLMGGFLSEKWLRKSEPKIEALATWSQMKYKRFIDAAGGWEVYQNLLQAMKQVAEKHGVSIANMASRFVLENPHVAAVIIGARLGESEHIEDNKKLLEIDLDETDIATIKAAQKQLKPIPGDCGDEYRKPPFLTASGDLSDHLETFPPVFEPITVNENRQQLFSGTAWEDLASYCRAVKDGNRIHVSGTTATHGNLLIGGNDPAAQTHFVIDKIEAAITSFGGKLADVVRTRIFVNNISDWEPVARAHGERFRGINPANTLVQAQLVGDGYLVEIEAEAVVG